MSGWSDEPSSTTTQAPAPATTGWSDDPNPAQESVKLSSGITPDTAAQVLHLSDKTGLPTDFVSRNADALQTQADNAAITPQFSQNHPVTTAYVGEDPHQAAVAGSDIPVLGAVERQFKYMANQTERGGLDVERQFRGMLKAFGYQDGGNDQRISDIEDRLQGDLNMQAPGPISNVLGKVAESAPILGGGLAIGAAATAASLPASVAAGGTAAAFGALEFGNAFLDFSKRKDAAGNPAMTADEARGFSLISGALNGAMFMVPAEKMLSKMPGLRMLTGEGLRSLISNPSALGALRTVGADIGKTGLAMGGFSGMSTLVHSVAGHLGEIKGGSVQPASVSEFISTLFPSEDLKAAASSAASGAVTGGIIGATEGGVGVGLDFRNYTKSMEAKDVYYAQRYKQAQETAQGWNNIGSALQGTKMAEIAPGQVDKLVSRMAPDSHVYIPMEHWQSYWEGQKADPRAAYLAAVGDTKSYDESMRTGADLQVPAGKYASSIAASDHGEFFNNVLRADPLAMSAEDAKQSLGLTKEIEKEKEDAANKIKDSVIPPPLPEPETEPITPAPDIHTKEAQMVQGQEPLFVSPRAEGMSDDMAGKYRQAIDEARGKAQEDITRQIVDKELRQKSSAWLEERSEVQAQVEKETKQRPEYQAIEALQSNTDVANNFGVKTFKLDKKIVEEMDPTGSTKSYPIGMMAESGGLHPDDAAHIFGFNSGSELLYNLKTSPKFDDVVREETDRQMMARHPEISNDNIMDRAMEAVHSTERSKVLRLELQHLASDDFAAFKGLSRKIARRVPSTEEIRSDAEQTIGQKVVGDTAPLLYQRAESIASREAQEHFLRGDFEKAFEAKLQELRNHELYRAAKNAKEQTAKDVNYFKRFSKDSVRDRIAQAGRAGNDGLQQIDRLLEPFDFHRVTQREIQERKDLASWIGDTVARGYDIGIPDKYLNESLKQNYREMTNSDIQELRDTIKQIEHVSLDQAKVFLDGKKQDFDDYRNEVSTKIREHYEIPENEPPPKLTRTTTDKFVEGTKSRVGEYWGPQWISEGVDGWESNGPFWRGTNKQLNEAMAKQIFHTQESDRTIKNILDSTYTPKEQEKLWKVIVTPEVNNQTVSKWNILMMAANMGNRYNSEGMLEGMGHWATPDQVNKLLENHLSLKEWEMVEKLARHIESFRPEIAGVERRTLGVEPQWVEGDSIKMKTSDGQEFKSDGWYWPIQFDPSQDKRQAQAIDQQAVQDMFGGSFAKANTRPGQLKARTDTAGRPFLLNPSVITSHLYSTIHDFTHREAVINTYKVINDPQIKNEISHALGSDIYDQLNPMLKRVAGEKSLNPYSKMEGLISGLRQNVVESSLAWRVLPALKHFLNFPMAVKEIDKGSSYPEYSLKGLGAVYSKGVGKAWQFITERDPEMLNRGIMLDPALRERFGGYKTLSPNEGAIRKSYRIFLTAADLLTSMPTWMGAYLKAMDGKVENIPKDEHGRIDEKDAIAHARRIVEMTKGSGAPKDLPAVMYGSPAYKLWTTFYTPSSVMINNLNKYRGEYGQNRSPIALAAGMMAGWFLPAFAHKMISGGFSDKEKEHPIESALVTGALYPMNGIIFGRDIAHAIESTYAYGQPYGGDPMSEFITDFSKSAYAIGGRISGDKDELSESDISNILGVAGALTGKPLSTGYRALDNLYDWYTGDYAPETTREGIWSVISAQHRHK